MANRETQLNLRLTAQDEARAVLREFVAEVRTTFESIRTMMGETFNMSGLSNAAAAGREIQASMAPVASEMKAVADEAKAVTAEMNAAGKAAAEMGAKAAAAGREAATAGEEASRFFKAGELMLAGTMLEDTGKHMLGFFANSVKAAADFDTNVHNVVASLIAMGDHAQKPQQAFDALKKKALDLGMTGFFSANEIADAMNTMARQGITSKQILGGAIEEVSAVAAANQQDLQQTSNVMSDIIHQMGGELKTEFGANFKTQMQGVGDAMTKALHNGKLSMDDFLSTMRYAGPQAAAAGWSFKDLAGSIALLAQHGTKGSMAGTTLRRMLTNLIPATKQQKEMFDQLGFTVHGTGNVFLDAHGKIKPMADVQKILHDRISKLPPALQQMAIKTIFGQYALSGMTTIINESPSAFSALIKSMGETGVTQEALKEKSKSLGYQINQMKKHFETLQKEIGEYLAPLMVMLVSAVNSLFAAWQKLPDGVQKAIVIFGAVTAAVMTVGGAIMVAISSLRFLWLAMEPVIEGAGLFVAEFGLPILGVIAAVVAAIAVLKYTWDHNLGGIRQVTAQVWGFVKAQFNAAMAVLRNTVGAGIKAVMDWWHKLSPDFNKALSNVIKILVALAPLWKGIWNELVNTVSLVWNSIVTVVQGAWKILSGIFQIIVHVLSGDWGKLWGDVKQILSGALGIIIGLIGNFVTFIINGFTNVLKTIDGLLGGWPSKIIAWFGKMFNDIVKGFDSFGKDVENAWKSFQQWISDAAKAVTEFIVKAFEWLYNHNYYFKDLVDFIVNAWKRLDQITQQVWNAIKSFFSSVFNAISSVAKSVWSSIVSYLEGVFNRIKSSVSSAWNSVSSKISSAWNAIKGYVHSGVTFIWNLLSNLASQALHWGSNMMDMFVQGIESGVGKVVSAVKGVAKKVASFLGFHSPTEEGPAADSDKWMPNMMQMFADGINDHQPLIEAAVTRVAEFLKSGFSRAHAHVDALRAVGIAHQIAQAGGNIPLPGMDNVAFLRNAYENIAGHTSHSPAAVSGYEWVPGHTSHSPSVGYFDRVAGHGTKNVTVNIHVDGHSSKTVDHLAEKIAAKFREQMKIHY